MCDHADGGGARPWITVARTNGSVMGLDLERDDELLYLYNSSLPQFVATFTYLTGSVWPERIFQ
jgi:hypothetical protein